MKFFVALLCCMILAQTQAQKVNLTPADVIQVRNELAILASIIPGYEKFMQYFLENQISQTTDNNVMKMVNNSISRVVSELKNNKVLVPLVDKVNNISTQLNVIFTLYRAKGISTAYIVGYVFVQFYYNTVNVFSTIGNKFSSTIPVIERKSVTVKTLNAPPFTENELLAISKAESIIKDNLDSVLTFFMSSSTSTYLVNLSEQFMDIIYELNGIFQENVPGSVDSVPDQTKTIGVLETVTKIICSRAKDPKEIFKQLLDTINDTIKSADMKFTASSASK